MPDVNDGEYVGELSPEEVIEQFNYRIGIHETYAGLVEDDPVTWAGYGTYEFHLWAINGYEWGIKYIENYIALGDSVSPVARRPGLASIFRR